MTLNTSITLFLILSGGVVMFLSVLRTRRIFRMMEATRYRKNWSLLAYLMVFFLVGYLLAAYIVWQGYDEILALLTGIVFFMGAAFVYIVVNSGLKTIHELTDHTRRSIQKTKKLKSSKTELKRINEELNAHNQELTKFNHIAAHDLQAPLHNISSIITLLERDHKHEFGEGAQEYLSFIARSSERMRNLIIALLDYSKIGSKKTVQDVDLNLVLSDVIEDHDTIIKERKAQINFQDLPVVKGHRIELTQLFQNLLTNALKFSSKDSIPKINITSTPSDDVWHFTFSDNGIGIADEDKDRIFDMFHRVHTMHEYEGSGIGLANCKKIVELHGGEIWVESAPGTGSKFHFTVPEN